MKNNPLKYIIILILAFCLINKSYQIFYILDPHETRCISKLIFANSVFSGSYFVSGQEEQSNNAVIKNPKGEIIWKDNGHSNGSFNLEVANEGVYSLCLESISDLQLTISFDFHDEKKNTQAISVHNIESLNHMMINVRRRLDIIHSNMRNSAVRRQSHLGSIY